MDILGSKESDAKMAEDWRAISAKFSVEDEASTLDETPEAPEEVKDEKPRDEAGKFKKAEKIEKAAPEIKAEPEATKAPEQAQEATQEAPESTQQRSLDLNRAPSSWKPAAKAAWANLAPEIRAEVLRREEDFMKGQSGLLPDAQLGKSIRQVIEPYRMLIESEGGTPETAVGSLLRTAAIFRTGSPQQKQMALQQIAMQYGIPMPQPQIGGEQGQIQQPQVFEDPRLTTFLQRMEQQEKQKAQFEEQQRMAASEKWMRETDAKGSPLRPFVDDVADQMVPFISQIKAANPALGHGEVLQQAYDRAIWAHPEIRPILLKQQQDELEAKRREENLLKAKEAKKAASVNVPRRTAAAPQAPRGSMDQTIAETARNLGLIS